MPNWSDGEGGCDCPSGNEAGLGFHRSGQPGCINGPDEFAGKKTMTLTFIVDERVVSALKLVHCPDCLATPNEVCVGRIPHEDRIAAAALYVKRLSRTDIETLIERSSLGTPQAKRIRASTTPQEVDAVMKRLGEITRKRRH